MATNAEALMREKRLLLRSAGNLRASVIDLSKKTPSLENVQKAGAYIETLEDTLKQLRYLNLKLCDHIDTEKYNTDALLEQAEIAITKEHDKLQLEINSYKGTFRQMKCELEKQDHANRTLPNETLNTSFMSSDSIKLPNIKVPIFDGKVANYMEWESMYEALIHTNTGLKPRQKFHYLKQALEENTNVLKNFETTAEGYEDAYEHVKTRYQNRRKIIENHFRTLFTLPTITEANLRDSLDLVQATVRGLKACKLDTEKMSQILAYSLIRKLPDRIREDWENSISDNSMYPSFKKLDTWLNTRCLSLESLSHETPPKAKPKAENKSKSSLPVANTSKPSEPHARPAPKCFECGEAHYLTQCRSFLSKSMPEREQFVISKRLCRNCFRTGHKSNVCNSSKCRECGCNHHTTLHVKPNASDAAKANNKDDTASKVSCAAVRSNVNLMLPTAVVKVRIGSRYVLARALIDSCSQVELVTEAFVKRHKLKKYPSSTSIRGVSPTNVLANYVVTLIVESRQNDTQIRIDAEVIGSLPYNIEPRIFESISAYDTSLNLADHGLDSKEIDILIGAKFAARLTTGEKRMIDELCLENSQFGWLTVGPVKIQQPDPRVCYLSLVVHDVLSKFWEVEEVTPPKRTLSEFEQCEKHFQTTRTRLTDGRFQVRLPFRDQNTTLANTYQQARSALLKYEKSNESIRSQYVEFMRDYLDRGHMRLADPSSTIPRYFIPHLPVLRAESSTTKLRVVFNASAKNNSGISLNENLLNGQIRQSPLFNILVKFRKYLVAFSADVEKMYRQIIVHEDDRRFQSILWRFSVDEPIQTYELNTLTYGTGPAAYQAIQCLQETADDVPADQPEVAEAIKEEFWLDDELSGDFSVQKAIIKAKRIHNTLLKGKFPLRKYVSNSKEFLDALPPEQVEKLRPVSFSSSGVAKILGLQWYPTNDEFRINFKPVDLSTIKLTKRTVSSLIASVYDPLGLVNPILIRGKILLQDLWREELEWDDHIPEKIDLTFREYYEDLQNLEHIHIPRPYATFYTDEIELIGFSDASDKAYGAVVYVKSRSNSSIAVTLACSKSKVAPIKSLTIPRLELLGAVLLCKLISTVATTLNYDVSKSSAYCDSTVVLAWLKGPASKYQVFVRNRIDYVNSILPYKCWKYVNTKQNPADLVTCGVNVDSLVSNKLWLHGPSWLIDEAEIVEVELPSDPPERRNSQVSLVTCATTVHESHIARFSSFNKLVRITMLVKTFIVRLCEKSKTASVTNQEAIDAVYQISQRAWFQSEINALKSKAELPKRSLLISINPFIDPKGVLRVGGRLRNSRFSYNVKFPIILHAKSEMAKLLANHIHENYYHSAQTSLVVSSSAASGLSPVFEL